MTTNNLGKQLAHQRHLSDRSPFGQVQGNELIEVLQEIRDELRDLNAGQDLTTSSEIKAVAINVCEATAELKACSASLTAIAEILEEK